MTGSSSWALVGCTDVEIVLFLPIGRSCYPLTPFMRAFCWYPFAHAYGTVSIQALC